MQLQVWDERPSLKASLDSKIGVGSKGRLDVRVKSFGKRILGLSSHMGSCVVGDKSKAGERVWVSWFMQCRSFTGGVTIRVSGD